MTRVLITGMSGTGKSSVVAELRRLGLACVEMDDPGWCYYDGAGNQLWCEDQLEQLLAEDQSDFLFISGCAENQARFYAQMDHIILLSTPVDVMLERLSSRTNNAYGKKPAELAAVLDNLKMVEPLLRNRATCEIVTTIPVRKVVERILNELGIGNGSCDVKEEYV